MAEAARTTFEANPFAALGDGAAVWNFGMQQIESSLQAQVQFLGNLQAATETYWRHRRQNIEDTAIALRRMYECKDFGEAATIQQKLMAAVIQSLIEDLAALSRTAPLRGSISEQQPASRKVEVTKAAR